MLVASYLLGFLERSLIILGIGYFRTGQIPVSYIISCKTESGLRFQITLATTGGKVLIQNVRQCVSTIYIRKAPCKTLQEAFWGGRPGSNRRPLVPQTSALTN